MCITAKLYGSSPCLELNIRSSNLTLPLGLKLENLSELVGIFKGHSVFQDMGAMVLYGSRVHHKAGYAPNKESDLDMSFIAGKELTPEQRFDVMLSSPEVFKKISEKVGFSIKEEIPVLDSQIKVMADTSLNRFRSRTREYEKEVWEVVASKNLERKLAKNKFLENLQGGFTRDALFVLKGPHSASFKAFLNAKNFVNILVIP
jgi:hypothetical protein